MSGTSSSGLAPDALDLAALLCSRVCHDLISPVGAIVNGLEVLDDNPKPEDREFAIFGLRIVVEDLKPIDDGANRADEIMTDPRTQKRRQIEGVGSEAGRRSARHQIFLESRAVAMPGGRLRITHARLA